MTDESQDMNSWIRAAAGVEGDAGADAQEYGESQSDDRDAEDIDSLRKQIDSIHVVLNNLLKDLSSAEG